MRVSVAVNTLVMLLTVGCTPIPDRIAFSEAVPEASKQEVYVVSGSPPSPSDQDPTQDRNALTRYIRYDVSIPPSHKVGQIEWPKGSVNASSDFVVTDRQDLLNRRNLIRTLEAKPGDEVALFVHGYNNTPSEALYRFAQIGHDFDITSPRVLFSWPSAGRTAGYVYDRDSVLFSRDPLVDLLTDISRGTTKEITLIAHSMGAHLAMEALRQIALTGRRDILDDFSVVLLLAPDIDPDIFRTQAASIGKLPQPFVIMASQKDRALRLSAIANIGRQKVGDLSRASDVAGLDIVLFDFTALSDGSSRDHLVPFTSPRAIAVLRDLVKSDQRGDVDLSDFEIGDDGVIRAR